jgi:phosphomannomutase/phosphoglucomutase
MATRPTANVANVANVANLAIADKAAAFTHISRTSIPTTPVRIRLRRKLACMFNAHPPGAAMSAVIAPADLALPAEVFRPSCVRGQVRQALTPAFCKLLGQALGSEARARGFSKVVVCRDARLLSQDYASSLMGGLNEAGVDVVDLMLAPIGVMQVAAHDLAQGCGVMVSGGRSPASQDGFKAMLGGAPLGAADWQRVQQRMAANELLSGSGEFDREPHSEAYIDRMAGAITLARPIKLVLDHGNGATAVLGAELFQRLGCTVHEIWPQLDGNFPNHFPDPTHPDNLVDAVSVQRSSAQGELGVVFSGDGAGLAVVDTRGYAVDPDRVLMFLAADVLAQTPGATIVGDVRCSDRVGRFVSERGGRFVMAPVGHARIEAVMRQTGALLAGDHAGHFYFADHLGHDDALYAAARLAQALARHPDMAAAAAALAACPKAHSATEVRMKASEQTVDALLNDLALQTFDAASIQRLQGGASGTLLEGLRIVWPDGLCVVRASTTSTGLAARFEGSNPAALQQSQARFKAAFAAIRPGVDLPF